MVRGAEQTRIAEEDRLRRARLRAIASAELALGLVELLRAGANLPQALAAIAERHRQEGDPLFPVLERIAVAVRDEGKSLFDAVAAERLSFSQRFVAMLALANLGGPLFRVFVGRLREFVREFNALPPQSANEFPPLRDEVREFCFFFGHLTKERASQPEIQRWLPLLFGPKLKLPTTHLLSRFYEQGLLLSHAFIKTPPFDDPEMILAVQAGEELNRVGRELIDLADWLDQRRLLEEKLRLAEMTFPKDLAGESEVRTAGSQPEGS